MSETLRTERKGVGTHCLAGSIEQPQCAAARLQDRVGELERQLAESEALYAQVVLGSRAKHSALTALREQSKAWEQNDRRYRWLRECSIVRSDRSMYVLRHRYDTGVYRDTEYPSHAELDAIIDREISAALAVEPKGNK